MLIYLAQLTHRTGNQNQNRHFPLAIGYLGSYLRQVFGDQIEVRLFKQLHALDEATRARTPDLIGFSVYMWNERISLAFARRLKSQSPKTLVVVGGPNVTLEAEGRKRFFSRHPFVDKLVHRDGEYPLEAIVRTFLDTAGNIDAVRKAPLAFTSSMAGGELVLGSEDEEMRVGLNPDKGSIDHIDSPYTTGMMDEFFADGEVPLLETNKGCPFTCTFCQQGDAYYTKVRHFSTARIAAEIDYIAKKVSELGVAMTTVEFADPNFGMFARDREVTLAVRAAQDRYGFPKYVYSSTGKNRAELILANNAVLAPGSTNLRSAIQSNNAATLTAIRRKNIKLEAYQRIQEDMGKQGLGSVADLMLGLPEETAATHTEGIYALLDTDVREFSCLQTIILTGTEMAAPEYRQRHAIQTAHRAIPECYGTYHMLGEAQRIIETEEIVTSTRTLGFEDYLNCRRLHLVVMIFHNTRILDFVYEIMKKLGVPRHRLIKSLFESKRPDFVALVDDFIADTESEIFRDEATLLAQEDIDALTYNKIFKHLAIAFFKKRDVMFGLLEEKLGELLQLSPDVIDEVLEITRKRIVTIECDGRDRAHAVKSPYLQDVLGESLQIFHSDHQRASLEFLKSIYETPDDRVNKMVYRLRPGNLTMKINSVL
ncbi:MAG TPA: cobalamin-dependent protein [Polyangiaceae bacterium]|nr:cobalamin-dependent protein [Polyangiaceae bacterium]